MKERDSPGDIQGGRETGPKSARVRKVEEVKKSGTGALGMKDREDQVTKIDSLTRYCSANSAQLRRAEVAGS